MRVGVLGQGSIGRRHAAIARDLGHEVSGYDTRSDTPEVKGVERAKSEAEAVEQADAVIIASPPSEHLHQARLALDSGVHTLVEKPVAPSSDGVAALAALARERGVIARAGMNLRFHPGVSTLREVVVAGTIGRPLRASVWCGSWLPDWRPRSDYRETYSARSELGGGALLDAIHELDYAIWMLGPVVRVSGLLTRASALEIDVEDIAALVLEHEEGSITSVTLDYLDHAYSRGCRVVGERGTAWWNWDSETVLLKPASGQVEEIPAPGDIASSYEKQLESFLAAARGGQTPLEPPTLASNLEEAATVLTLADAARRASARRATVDIPLFGLALRPATHEDSGNLLRWRNDPLTRAASLHSEEISPPEHTAWLERTLADPNQQLMLASQYGVEVGQLRLNRLEGGTAEVHIALAPEARGRGIAARLLSLAAREHASGLGAERLMARIKSENEPSRRSFSRAGFRQDREQPELWWLTLPFAGGQLR